MGVGVATGDFSSIGGALVRRKGIAAPAGAVGTLVMASPRDVPALVARPTVKETTNSAQVAATRMSPRRSIRARTLPARMRRCSMRKVFMRTDIRSA
jgi:hypothetical protein